MITYRYLVETDGPSQARRRYDGTDAADAMAAWTKAILDGVEYVTLEALRDTRQDRLQQAPCPRCGQLTDAPGPCTACSGRPVDAGRP
jgi:hypothetical protein